MKQANLRAAQQEEKEKDNQSKQKPALKAKRELSFFKYNF
jgi:hypothetical protein